MLYFGAGELKALLKFSFDLLRGFHPGVVKECSHVDSAMISMKIQKDEARRILGIPLNACVVLTAAKVVPENGHMQILDALRKIAPGQKKSLQWWIIGSHPNEVFSQRFCNAINLSGLNFFMPGLCSADELALRFSASDIFCILGAPAGNDTGGLSALFCTAHAFGMELVGTRGRGAEAVLSEGGDVLFVDIDESHRVRDIICDAIKRHQLTVKNIGS